MADENQKASALANTASPKDDSRLRTFCLQMAVEQSQGKGAHFTDVVMAAAAFEKYVREGK